MQNIYKMREIGSLFFCNTVFYREAIGSALAEVLNMEHNVDLITHKLIEQKLRIQAIFGEQMTEAKVYRKKKILEDRLYLVRNFKAMFLSFRMHEIHLFLCFWGKLVVLCYFKQGKTAHAYIFHPADCMMR